MTRLLVVALAAALGHSRPASSRIVVASDRYGAQRGYSIRPDGSRWSPLLHAGRGAPIPAAVSGDGATIAYSGAAVSISRADGTGLRRVVGGRATIAGLSRDGRVLAFERGNGIWIVGADGRGLRRLTSGRSDTQADLAPDGRTVAFTRSGTGVLLQPVQGRSRVLARGGTAPRWSPDGSWISYVRGGALYAVRRDGTRRHRVAGSIDSQALGWSPDGGTLAFESGGRLVVARATGGAPRVLPVRLDWEIAAVRWSPDQRRIAFELDRADVDSEVWTTDRDGRHESLVAGGGRNSLVGWSTLVPVLPAAPPLVPSERVAGPTAVATRSPVDDLSADGSRVAFVVGSRAIDCDHVVVWTPAARALRRFTRPAPCEIYNGAGATYGLALAGSRVGWTQVTSCGNSCESILVTATLAARAPAILASGGIENTDELDYHLHGDGSLLVYDDGERLVRIGVGKEVCQERGDYALHACTTLRRGEHAAPVEAVGGGLVAVLEDQSVAVLDERGKLLRTFPFGAGEVVSVRLDGGRLVVARAHVLEVYDVATGKGVLQRPLPAGSTLTDVDRGIAVLQHGVRIVLLRLGDGRSLTLAPGRGPVQADLEPPGLYYSYATKSGGGRVAFHTRAEVERRLR
jgi:dipeptidyl aminopeptidase/acylaminoacyl peptidase